MRRHAGWLVGLASTMLAVCHGAPPLWSPDSRWVAYTVAARDTARVIDPGWLYRAELEPADGLLRGWIKPLERARGNRYRIWATDVESGLSVLLEQSAAPLSSPAWSPDGRSLAFLRAVPLGGERVRYEVVVQDAPDHKRVILAQPAVEDESRSAELPGLIPAWSREGRLLAVPWCRTQEPGSAPGLAILRADNGRILKEIPDASLPSWSPDGSSLAYVRGGRKALTTQLGLGQHTVYVVDSTFGPSRELAVVGQVYQPPVWSRDKRSVMLVVKGRRRGGMAAAMGGVELLRLPVDGGLPESVALPIDRTAHEGLDLGYAYSLDAGGDQLFCTVDLHQGESQVAHILLRRPENRRGENPVDASVRINSLALSPSGKSVAFGAGGPPVFSTPGLWDLEKNGFVPLVPDDAARGEWIGRLVAAARAVIHQALPAVVAQNGRTIERPTILPIPGELPANHESVVRLARLGRAGRALCDRPPSAPPADPELQTLIDEARLFFCYLSGDYDAALAALETVEARAGLADHRLRLMSVRAQVYIAQGDQEGAEQTIEFLEAQDRAAPRLIETTPAGTTLTPDDSPGRGWPDYIAARARSSPDAPAGDGVNPPPPFQLPDAFDNGRNGFGGQNGFDGRRDDVNIPDAPGGEPRPGIRMMRRRGDMPFRGPGDQIRRREIRGGPPQE